MNKINDFLKKFKSKKQNNSNESSTIRLNSLKDAYELLQLEYPTSYEEIREAYLIATFASDNISAEDEKIYKMARSMIEQDIYQDPNDAEPIGIGYKSDNGIHIQFKLPKFFKKKNTPTVSSILENKPKKKKATKEPKVKFNWKASVGLTLLFMLVTFAYQNRDNNNREVLTEIPEINQNSSDYDNEELSLALLARDGIQQGDDTLNINLHKISEVSLNDYKIFNYCIFRRVFNTDTDALELNISEYSIYKQEKNGSGISSYEKIKDLAKITVSDAELSGVWQGEGLLLGKYELEDINLDINVKESGYLQGVLEFNVSGKEASINIEGKIDKNTLDAQFKTVSWNKRPNLLVSPINLDGKLNVYTGEIKSTRDTKNSFHLQKVENDEELIKSDILALLKREHAKYSNNQGIYSISLDTIEQVEISVTTDDETASLTYSGLLPKSIALYDVKGIAKLSKDNNGEWYISENDAVANLKLIKLSGTYTGTEQMADKEFSATYEILDDNGDEYEAKATLTHGITIVTEKRLITVNQEDYTIQIVREDVIDGKVFEMKAFTANIDFENDSIDGALKLHRE